MNIKDIKKSDILKVNGGFLYAPDEDKEKIALPAFSECEVKDIDEERGLVLITSSPSDIWIDPENLSPLDN